MKRQVTARPPIERRQAGYTLTEVLVAIGIAAIVSGIAVPNLRAFSAEYQLTSAARSIGFDVAQARMKAVGENIYCRVRFAKGSTGTGGTYWLETSNDGTTYKQDGVASQLPSQVSYSWLPDVPPTFDPQGLGLGYALISLTNTVGQTKHVNVNILGKVRVQ